MKALLAIPLPAGLGTVADSLPALAAALDGSGPALLASPQLPGRADDRNELEGAALVVATSGSTGEPKEVVLTAAAIQASAAATHRRLGGPGRWMLALPLTSIAGLMVLARSVDAGTEPAVVDSSGGFRADAFIAAWPDNWSGRTDPVYTSLVPTQLLRLLDAGVDLTRFDAILLGGAPAPPTLLAQARAAGARVITTYGMTETCGGCVYDGVGLDGVDLAIDDEGRITIGGPTLFTRYRGRPDLTAAALTGGRFVTEDLGRIAADGRLEVLGRADDVVITGAVKVTAGLVSQVVASHPQVRECVVVGVPDKEWGERVVAVVVAADPGHPLTLADLRAFAAQRLQAAAVPADLVIVAQLPLLASGKPDRERVRTVAVEHLADGLTGGAR